MRPRPRSRGRRRCPRGPSRPRRLAAAVRGNTHAGPLPAPSQTEPALRALDDALLHAAEAFDRGRGPDLHVRRRSPRPAARAVLGPGGREYGLRVGLCFGASAAVAQALHHGHWYGSHQHWYWLPATAVFLVKPDLGRSCPGCCAGRPGRCSERCCSPASRPCCPGRRGSSSSSPSAGPWCRWPRGTSPPRPPSSPSSSSPWSWSAANRRPPRAASGRRCWPARSCWWPGTCRCRGSGGADIRAGIDAADAAAQAYLTHVLGESDDRATRWTLRREAYRTLAEARAASARAAAELPALARHSEGTDEVAAVLERLVDTTTACAVHLDDTGRLTSRHTERLAALRDELAERRGRVGGHRTLA
ncbi:FUSC family protein [Streptomyces violaceorubidus]